MLTAPTPTFASCTLVMAAHIIRKRPRCLCNRRGHALGTDMAKKTCVQAASQAGRVLPHVMLAVLVCAYLASVRAGTPAWTPMARKDCPRTSAYSQFNTTDAAIEACAADNSCCWVSDHRCDGRGGSGKLTLNLWIAHAHPLSPSKQINGNNISY